MNKYQAQRKAHTQWYRRINGTSDAIGDRFGWTTLRSKSVPDRYQVGYSELVEVGPGRERWRRTMLGSGDSWDEAFKRAGERECHDSASGANLPRDDQ